MRIILMYGKRCDSYVVDLPSACSVVDSSVVEQKPHVLDVDVIALDGPDVNEVTDGQTVQLPDGTLAVIRNLSQCQYQCMLSYHYYVSKHYKKKTADVDMVARIDLNLDS